MIPAMPDEGLLLGIAQIAVVVAGFTAVTAALTPPGGSWSLDQRIRQRAIVSTSFNVVFESLLAVIAFAWFGDAHTALVVSSAAVAVYTGWVLLGAGPPVPQDQCVSYAERPAAVHPRAHSPALLFAANAIVSCRWPSTRSRCASSCPWQWSASTRSCRRRRADRRTGGPILSRAARSGPAPRWGSRGRRCRGPRPA